MRFGEGRIRLIFAVAAALLFGAGLVAWRNRARAADANRLVGHTHEVLEELQATRVSVTEVQSSVRELLLPGGSPAHYRQAAAAVPPHLARLRELFHDTDQIKHLDAVDAIAARWRKLTDTFAETVATKGPEAAFEQALASPDFEIAFQITSMLAGMTQEEHGLLEKRTRELEASNASSSRAFLVFGFSGALLLLLSYFAVARELRARHSALDALTQSEERFRLLVGNVVDYAIVMLDPSGRVATWNSGAERLNGYKASEIIGQHFAIFHLPEEAALGRCAELLARSEREGHVEDEGWRLRKDGSRFWANVTIAPVRAEDGGLRGFAKVTRDRTERVRAEETRLKLAQADEGLRVRDELISVASHELRTPLTPLSLHLHKIQRAIRNGEVPEDVSVARALRQVRRLDTLIEDLLDVTRMREGKLEMAREHVDLADVVEGVTTDFKGVSERHEIAIERNGAVPVLGDRLRLEQVIVNLLQNAVKYSPEGGRITISVGTVGNEGRVSVRDPGIGIPPDEREQVFKRFFRASNAQHKNFGGLGLGLFLSHEIILRHGGTFDLQSEEGHGSTFTFAVPVAAPGEITTPATGTTVLLVDDDPDVRIAVSETLRDLGYQVDTAGNGLEALARITAAAPDVMLVDLMMPLMDGAGLIDRVRRDRLVPRMPIIVISADHRAVARARSGEPRVDGALTKPLDAGELNVTITRLMAAREASTLSS